MQSKSNQNNKITYERLTLTESADLRSLRNEKLWHIAAAVLLAIGCAGILSCFSPAGGGIWLYAAAAVYSALLVAADAGHSLLRAGGFVLLIVAAVVFSPAGFLQGFMYFMNQCITLFNARFSAFVSLLQVSNCTNVNVLQFEFALLAAVCWLVYAVIMTKKVFPVTLFCLVQLAVVGFGGLSVAPLVCGIFSFGWLLCWIEKSSGCGGIRKNLLSMTALAVALCLIVALMITKCGEVESGMLQLHQNAVTAVNTVRYGSDTLPGGSMVSARNLGNGNQSALTVSFTDEPQELYLKGFVGGSFDGTAWEEPDPAIYHGDNDGIIRWLSENGLTVPFQYGTYYGYTSTGKDDGNNTVNILNTGANRKYLYLPYQASSVSLADYTLRNDSGLAASGFFGANHYSYATVNTPNFDQNVLRENLDPLAEGGTAFSDAEAVYRSFVKEQYLDVSEPEQQVINDTFFSGGEWNGSGLAAVTKQIRIVLQSLAQYNTTPDEFAGDSDFVSWLVAGGKKANSAYYATAAVLAFRCAGMPARYAEGYCLTDTAVERMKNTNNLTASLTDSNAHAWAEVYFDGVGWIPVETTPGFYYAEYSISQVIGQPDSAVNITDDAAADELGGSTADSLQAIKKAEKPQEPAIERAVHLVGIAVLILLLLWAAYAVLEFQAVFRQRRRRKTLFKASPEQAVRLLFHDCFRIFRAAGYPQDGRRPQEALSLFETVFPGIEPEEYTAMVDLLQKTVFGEIQPKPEECVFAARFLQRLTDVAYARSNVFRKLVMKYGYACFSAAVPNYFVQEL